MSSKNDIKTHQSEESNVLPDLTSPEEARKAFIAAEVFNRKY